MNDINELINIIDDLGGVASFESICEEFQKNKKIVLSQSHKIIISKTLNDNPHVVRVNKEKEWEIIQEQTTEMDSVYMQLSDSCREALTAKGIRTYRLKGSFSNTVAFKFNGRREFEIIKKKNCYEIGTRLLNYANVLETIKGANIFTKPDADGNRVNTLIKVSSLQEVGKIIEKMIIEGFQIEAEQNYSISQNAHNESDFNDFYKQASDVNGGLIIFIDLLDQYKVDYVLTSKSPSARASIDTRYGKIGVYDRVKNKLIRMDIPNKHPLSHNYEKYNGFLYNERNVITKENSFTSVYFKPKDFEKLILYIRESM